MLSDSNSALVKIAANIAPTPIGPKWPAKSASRQFLISGMTGFRTNIMGIRRKSTTMMAMMASLQGVRPSAALLYWPQGMMAPRKTKYARFSNRSMTFDT